MKRKPESVVISFAWYDEAQWELLYSLVPGRSELDDTYAEWKQSARRAISMIESNGHKPRCVPINVADLAEWCREHRRPINSEARAYSAGV